MLFIILFSLLLFLFFFYMNLILFIYLSVCLFSAALHSMWDLSYLTSDRTHTPCSGSIVLTTGPPVDSLFSLLFCIKIFVLTKRVTAEYT